MNVIRHRPSVAAIVNATLLTLASIFLILAPMILVALSCLSEGSAPDWGYIQWGTCVLIELAGSTSLFLSASWFARA